MATDVPRETHVIYRLVGGWQDYAALLRGCGAAQHTYHTDPTLPFTARWLGDPTPTMAYGLLFEGLVLEPAWLQTFPDLANVADLLVIAHLARQQRVRAAAAMVEVQRQLWASEPSSSIAVEYEERLTSATGVRYFGDEYLRATSRAPWEAGEAAVLVRASVLAAQLRQYLRHEFDEEWFRNPRAGRFLVQELWRTGRRHSAEALLSFMGYEGFDTTILWDESAEVLRTV